MELSGQILKLTVADIAAITAYTAPPKDTSNRYVGFCLNAGELQITATDGARALRVTVVDRGLDEEASVKLSATGLRIAAKLARGKDQGVQIRLEEVEELEQLEIYDESEEGSEFELSLTAKGISNPQLALLSGPDRFSTPAIGPQESVFLCAGDDAGLAKIAKATGVGSYRVTPLKDGSKIAQFVQTPDITWEAWLPAPRSGGRQEEMFVEDAQEAPKGERVRKGGGK